MNKSMFNIWLILFIIFFPSFSRASSWIDLSISAPACFGEDYSNMTSTIDNIIKCLNVKSTDAVEGEEDRKIKEDMINEYAANLIASAIVTRVLLFEENHKKETPQKSENAREIMSNETQGQIKKIAERLDAIIKLESSREVFEAMLRITEIPYTEY